MAEIGKRRISGFKFNFSPVQVELNTSADKRPPAIGQGTFDLGGDLPAWLVNTSIHRGPYETIQGMSRFVKKRKYRTAKLPYVKEPPVDWAAGTDD